MDPLNPGYAEKGSSTQGYNTTGFWGYYKNNSYLTSGFTTHASVYYGPGGTWGTFDNGQIGNQGSAILIHNGCDHVIINNCICYGFNNAGIQIGHLGDYFPVELGYTISTNITLSNNKIYSCYNYGIGLVACSNVTETNNEIYKIGHPNAALTDLTFDPGYGVACTVASTSLTVSPAIKVLSLGSSYSNCVRKGWDAHSGNDLSIISCDFQSCWAYGLEISNTSSSAPIYNVEISKNRFTSCGIKGSALRSQGLIDAAYVGPTSSVQNIRVDDNRFINCGNGSLTGIVDISAFSYLKMSGNEIISVDPTQPSGIAGFYIGHLNSVFYGTVTNQTIGTADGINRVFQLTNGSFPVGPFSAPSIYVSGVLQTLTTNYTYDSTGRITFLQNFTPAAASVISWSGQWNQDPSFEPMIKNNTVYALPTDTMLTTGFYLTNLVGGSVEGNRVSIQNTSAFVGYYTTQECIQTDFINNEANLSTTGTPFALAYLTGQCYGNTSLGGANASTLPTNPLTSTSTFGTLVSSRFTTFNSKIITSGGVITVPIPVNTPFLLVDDSGAYLLGICLTGSVTLVAISNFNYTLSSPQGAVLNGSNGSGTGNRNCTYVSAAGLLYIANQTSNSRSFTISVLG